MTKQNKGISLIVLVITIVVMIILAGAVIIMLTNNNVINKAKLAASEANKAAEKEAMTVAVGAALMKSKGGSISFEYLETNLPSSVTGSNGTYVGYQTYTISEKGVITVEGGETPSGGGSSIPGGHTVTFTANGETYGIISIKSGGAINEVVSPSVESKTFVGWFTQENGEGQGIRFPYTPVENMSLYGYYSNSVIKLNPVMTSNTSPSGVCSANTSYNANEEYKAFNDSSIVEGTHNTELIFLWALNTTVESSYLQYEFPTSKAITKVIIYPSFYKVDTSSGVSIKIQGSNDGIIFSDISNEEYIASTGYIDIGSYISKAEIDCLGRFKYIRIKPISFNGGQQYIHSSASPSCYIKKVEIYGTD